MNSHAIVVSVLRDTDYGMVEGYLAPSSEHGISRELHRAQLFASEEAALSAVYRRNAKLGRMFYIGLAAEVEAPELNYGQA